MENEFSIQTEQLPSLDELPLGQGFGSIAAVRDSQKRRGQSGRGKLVSAFRIGTGVVRSSTLLESGQRIREHGINSPFEEVAIAERLRQMGIRTTIPRAIYRTGHPSTRSVFLRDDRRFRDHAALQTPEDPPQPVLAPGYDYYTLWDCFRGIAPRGAGGMPSGTLIDLAHARDRALLTGPVSEVLLENARARLRTLGFTGERLEEDEFVATLSDGGSLRRDLQGEIELGLGLDAFTALEFGRPSEGEYRGLIRDLDGRLRAVDCEMLNLGGQHLLLSLGTDGRFREDEIVGELADLCSGAVTGRTSDDEVTLFKSVGTALQDLALAARYYELIGASAGVARARPAAPCRRNESSRRRTALPARARWLAPAANADRYGDLQSGSRRSAARTP